MNIANVIWSIPGRSCTPELTGGDFFLLIKISILGNSKFFFWKYDAESIWQLFNFQFLFCILFYIFKFLNTKNVIKNINYPQLDLKR